MKCTFLCQVLLALDTFIVGGDSEICHLNLMSLMLAVLIKTCQEKSFAVIIICFFLTVLYVVLQCVIMAVPGCTHLHFLYSSGKWCNKNNITFSNDVHCHFIEF